MSKANTTSRCTNVALGEGLGLSMDAARSKRFSHAMDRIANAIHSLNVAADSFPRLGATEGFMEPATTVRVFATQIDADIQFMYRMLEIEEEPEVQP